jgi:competence protein ComEA
MHALRIAVVLFALALVPLAASAAPVNVNTATAEEIAAALTGVGPSKAQAIVAYRAAHGPFASADDLARVKGIGAKTVDANRADIMLDTGQASKP